MGVLMVVALPPLLKVFNQMGASVPMMTRVAINLVAGVKTNFLSLLIGVAAAGTLFWLLRRIPKTSYWLDVAKTRTPVVGGFTVAGELARFARTVTLLLEAGVPLATALRLATSGCKNLAIRRAFNDAEESLVSGHGFADALKRHSVLPVMFVQLVMIGEESNSLRRTLGDAANAYQQQVEHRLNSLLALMEPVSTLVVGGIVGFIAFSMFVPIYSGLNSFK
jgi:type II secretory pathway component PulF